jgi:hypothetical protein
MSDFRKWGFLMFCFRRVLLQTITATLNNQPLHLASITNRWTVNYSLQLRTKIKPKRYTKYFGFVTLHARWIFPHFRYWTETIDQANINSLARWNIRSLLTKAWELESTSKVHSRIFTRKNYMNLKKNQFLNCTLLNLIDTKDGW